MADKLELVLPELVKVLNTITSPQGQPKLQTWEYPPEKLGALPTAVIFPTDFNHRRNPSRRDWEDDLTLNLYLARGDMMAAARSAVPWRFLLVNAIDTHFTLNGTVQSAEITRGKFGAIPWSDQESYIGWSMTLHLISWTPTTFAP